MRRFPQERSVLVVDNASVHKGEDVRELLDQAGVHLIYLPPYSPDLNPIEHAFSTLKARLRRQQSATRFDVIQATEYIQAPHARGFFQDCGYGRA
ncbi:hypothetical protein CF319_g5423 [Tilletia indica]|nr:hypothetical protein CF319_g5423 [Tilletia indica]